MGTPLEARLDCLRSRQNADGGWPYFAGKSSWLEPTAWALLALSSDPNSPSWNKGFDFVRSLQREDGAWRPSPAVKDAHWTTALAVTLHCAKGAYDQRFGRGLAWLVETGGAEGEWTQRLMHYIFPKVNEMDFSLQGWPWRPNNNSWVEPTAHTLIALRKAAAKSRPPKLEERVRMGEQMLLDRRCVDAGWNYGNRRVLETNLDSYPEMTAIALVGLQRPTPQLDASRRLARRLLGETASRLARAWLTLALRLHGEQVEEAGAGAEMSNDTLVTALEALGSRDGAHASLRCDGRQA